MEGLDIYENVIDRFLTELTVRFSIFLPLLSFLSFFLLSLESLILLPFGIRHLDGSLFFLHTTEYN